jgi:hypothetical protein
MKSILILRRLLVTIGVAFLLATQMLGCDSLPWATADAGSLYEGTYMNDYFGFTLTVPDNWYALDKKGMQEVTKAGTRMVTGNNKKMKAAVKAGEKNSLNLLMAYQHPLGAQVTFNPSIGCVAEKVGHVPGIRSGRDYLKNIKKFLSMSQFKMDFPEDIEAVSLGGVDFDLLYAEANVGLLTISQEYYASVQKGYALSFVISYVNDHQYSALQEALDSIRFEK